MSSAPPFIASGDALEDVETTYDTDEFAPLVYHRKMLHSPRLHEVRGLPEGSRRGTPSRPGSS